MLVYIILLISSFTCAFDIRSSAKIWSIEELEVEEVGILDALMDEFEPEFSFSRVLQVYWNSIWNYTTFINRVWWDVHMLWRIKIVVMNSDGIQGNITDFYSVPYETLRSKAYNCAVWGGIWANILWPCSRIPITLYCLVTTVSPIYSAKVVLQKWGWVLASWIYLACRLATLK